MRILFTGGTGKAGRHAIPYLLDQGHRVLNVDKVPLNLPGVDGSRMDNRIADITNAGEMFDVMASYASFDELEPGTGVPAFDAVVIYGDTNSTLAGALVAAKLHIPLAHVEAGLRSFNRRMPEEINRLVADRLAQWLFCPTSTAVENLQHEGIAEGVHLTGDVMLDATRFFADRAATHRPLSALTPHGPQSYYLATVHRAENTDDPARLAGIFEGLRRLDGPVILPLHPRTRARLAEVDVASNIVLMEPVSYLAMLTLVRNARRVFTDSGGLQKEAFWLGVPCVTLRNETEWVETLENGWNRCVGSDPAAIAADAKQTPTGPPHAFGEAPEGTASAQIARVLLQGLARS